LTQPSCSSQLTGGGCLTSRSRSRTCVGRGCVVTVLFALRHIGEVVWQLDQPCANWERPGLRSSRSVLGSQVLCVRQTAAAARPAKLALSRTPARRMGCRPGRRRRPTARVRTRRRSRPPPRIAPRGVWTTSQKMHV
jgi:hypothetical protein